MIKQVFVTAAQQLLPWLVPAVVVAWLLDLPWLLVVLLIWVLVRRYLNLYTIVAWLKTSMHSDDAKDPPESTGVWGELTDGIYSLKKANEVERRRLEANIQYLEHSFSSMSDAVVMTDVGGRIDWCNASATRLLGVRLERDARQYFPNLVRSPRFREYYGAGDFREPLVINAPHDESIVLEIRISRFGKGDRLVFARNVTRERQLDQMRKDFIDNVSHELRTPVTVLSGYLDTIEPMSTMLPASMQKAISNMHRQTDRMRALIEDLIWLSRLETVPVEDDADPVDVYQLVKQLVQDANEVAGMDRKISVTVDEDWNIKGCYKEIYSAFSNLVFNAVRYTPPDTKIRIIWQKTNLGGELRVADKGAGIEPRHLSRLTERFYRVEDSRAESTGGTGLGLAIVKHIMMRHQGELRISSVLGSGSTFSCHFPNSRMQNKLQQ